MISIVSPQKGFLISFKLTQKKFMIRKDLLYLVGGRRMTSCFKGGYPYLFQLISTLPTIFLEK